MAEFPTFKGSWPWPWPWMRSYCIPSCITRRPLPTYQISSKSNKLFVDGRTDGLTFETHFIRSTRRSRPNNNNNNNNDNNMMLMMMVVMVMVQALLWGSPDLMSVSKQQIWFYLTITLRRLSLVLRKVSNQFTCHSVAYVFLSDIDMWHTSFMLCILGWNVNRI